MIIKRSETDDFLPNCWEFPGGGVDASETIENALIREIKYDLGVSDCLNKLEDIKEYLKR